MNLTTLLRREEAKLEKQYKSIEDRMDALHDAITALSGNTKPTRKLYQSNKPAYRHSKEARLKMAEAQRRRWAKVNR
jgi:hypothetical protein